MRHYCRSSFSSKDAAVLPDTSYLLTSLKNFQTDDYCTVDDNGLSIPPLACAFAKENQNQHILSVVDEDGYLVLYNTHKTSEESVIKTWQIHNNAVFDLEWFAGENKILSGSGDQTIVLHDVSTGEKLETFRGHSSSIKSISCRLNDDAVFCSGSRDGNIMFWDKRIYHKENYVPPMATISGAHRATQQSRGSKPGRRQFSGAQIGGVQQSVTCVLFQNENYLISAGAVDGCLKVWDFRRFYRSGAGSTPVHVFHYPTQGSNTRLRGYSSLVKDSYGMRLFASCTDDKIYEYDIHNYHSTPVQCWSGHKNTTFYVKTALSPDDQFLLSGSSNDSAYIWQVNKPSASPIVLKGHTAEVTSVAWCPNDITKLVTVSDDAKTKLWRIYCRELDNKSLPPVEGYACKLSEERGTSTSEDPIPPIVTSQASSASEKVLPQSKVSSPKITRSPSILKWLKRNNSTEDPPEVNSKRQCQSSFDNDKSDSSSLKRPFDSLESSSSTSAAKKIKTEETDDSIPVNSNLLPEASSSTVNNDAIIPSIQKPFKPQILRSPTNSPAKRKRSGGSSENIPELSPSKIKKFSLEQDLPNRNCLSELESNQREQSDASCARISLFKDETATSCDTLKDFSPLKVSNIVSDSSIKTPSKSSSSLADFESPTQNLPNLVMDELAGKSPLRTPRTPSSRKKKDWLTKLRLQKGKKIFDDLPESPGEKGKKLLGKSPKAVKGMKTLDSYFKGPENN